MSKKKVVFTILLGASVMLIIPILGSIYFTKTLNPTRLSPIISMLLFYSLFIPGGFMSGYLLKIRGWLMGLITAGVLIAAVFLWGQFSNIFFSSGLVSMRPPSESIFVYYWNMFIVYMQIIPEVLIAGSIGGYLGEVVSKKRRNSSSNKNK